MPFVDVSLLPYFSFYFTLTVSFGFPDATIAHRAGDLTFGSLVSVLPAGSRTYLPTYLQACGVAPRMNGDVRGRLTSLLELQFCNTKGWLA